MKSIEHSRIITNLEAKSITDKEYQKLDKISSHIIKYIEQELHTPITDVNKVQYLFSLLIKSSKYNNLSNTEKEIITGKVLLPDDIRVVDILNKNNYTIEHIKTLLRFRTILKQTLQYKSQVTETFKKELYVYLQSVSHIIEIFKQEYNIDDATTILNRICEVFVRYPNHFDYKEFVKPPKK